VFDLAIEIFLDQYHKKYLHQLVSSQLDMDRLDYLTRDSYFSGVVEGSVGYDRIIHMLNVCDNQLVVEEKGIYSVEKFLMARRTMYWQVYLHKTALVAEKMLLHAIRRSKDLISRGLSIRGTDSFIFLLKNFDHPKIPEEQVLSHFLQLDDTDIIFFLKSNINHEDRILSILCNGLVYRKLFKVRLSDHSPEEEKLMQIRKTVKDYYKISEDDLGYLVYTGKEGNQSYNAEHDSIFIKMKEGGVKPVSALSSFFTTGEKSWKYYLCYPKEVLL
jgi:HD superfamily phosphohydrolase